MLSLSWLGTDPLSLPSASPHSHTHTLVCAIHGVPRVSPGLFRVGHGPYFSLGSGIPSSVHSSQQDALQQLQHSPAPAPAFLASAPGEASRFKEPLFSLAESWNSWSERTLQPNKVFPKQSRWTVNSHLSPLASPSLSKAALRQKSSMKSTILQDCNDFPEKPGSVLLWIRALVASPSLRGAHLGAGLTPFHCWITTKRHRRMQAYRTVISSSLSWTWEVKDMHQFKNRIVRHFLCSWALSGVWCMSTAAPGEGRHSQEHCPSWDQLICVPNCFQQASSSALGRHC